VYSNAWILIYFTFISFNIFSCNIYIWYLILYAWRYHWPRYMELPNMHAHTYENTRTHTKKTKVERDKKSRKENKRRGGSGKKEKKRKRTKRIKGKKDGKERQVGGGAKEKKKEEWDGFRGLEERGYWGGWNLILMTLDWPECFSVFNHKRTNNANNATYYVKLGKKRRESSKHNHCIISPRAIIRAIISIMVTSMKIGGRTLVTIVFVEARVGLH